MTKLPTFTLIGIATSLLCLCLLQTRANYERALRLWIPTHVTATGIQIQITTETQKIFWCEEDAESMTMPKPKSSEGKP